ncbi:MAG: AzlC family ABC transporter permease [Lachnospiraceae bacterium]|nr:AzlC family ABC transporter permease [Lachnospiraceae bacterium]
MSELRNEVKNGMIDSLPIAAGYLGVSFTFGILAVSYGIDAGTATLISLLNLTSAGQFAGITAIAGGAGFVELFLTQLIINLRYSLMSLSLSQKLSKDFNTPKRLVASFVITDEIFAVASSKTEPVRFPYMLGLGLPPIIGWSLGTFLGAVAGSNLPSSVNSALSVALYGMFVAIVLPPAREHKPVALVAVIALVISCLLYYVPLFDAIGSGFSVIITTLIAAGLGAVLFPIPED